MKVLINHTNINEDIDAINSSIYNRTKFKNSLSLDYILASKYSEIDLKKLSISTQNFYHPYIIARAAQPFKRYESAQKFYLNDYENNIERNLFKLLKERKSTKKYQRHSISLNELFFLMRYSYGINRKEVVNDVIWKFRPIPSGGGGFSSEVYVCILNGQIPQGLYHYQPDDNSLEFILKGDHLEVIKEMSGTEPYINSDDLSCIIFITSIIERLYIKYGERSYRFMLLEVGFLAQTISLLSEAIGLGSCIVGGYQDSKIEEYIGIDGILESVQCVLAIGKKVED